MGPKPKLRVLWVAEDRKRDSFQTSFSGPEEFGFRIYVPGCYSPLAPYKASKSGKVSEWKLRSFKHPT